MINHIKLPGVVYLSSKKQANQLANDLQKNCKLRVEAYHSGLDQESRYRIQHQFMNNQIDVICATSAFGMGIDKDDIRFVIHYHLPPDLGAYTQEIGRAGRDGKQSLAMILYQDHDEELPYTLAVDRFPIVR
ncbi:MAG: ATP-dependent DNA helicase RecQ [Acetilactobacillus jinshanensis]